METSDYPSNHLSTLVAQPQTETPALTIGQPLTAKQRYRKTDKCKVARERYYENKGKVTAHEYYMKHRETILQRSKERYAQLKAQAENI